MQNDWKELIEFKEEEKTLLRVNINNKPITSPRKLAQSYGEHLIAKLTKIKDKLPASTIIAEKTFKDLVPYVENDFKLKRMTIRETYKYIEKLKPSKCRGNDEVNNFIIKEIPQFMALSINHLYNHMIVTGVYPSCLKTSRIIPIKKPGKSSDNIDNGSKKIHQ